MIHKRREPPFGGIAAPTQGDDGTLQYDLEDDSPGRDEAGLRYIGKRVNGVLFAFARRAEGTPRMTADIVMLRQGRRYFGPDENIVLRHNDPKGRFRSADTYLPSQGDRPYFFYQSPGGRYLYVDRAVCHGEVVAYLYEVVAPHRLVPLRFGSLRLDEYVIGTFLKQVRQPAMLYRYENRMIRFEKWSGPGDRILRVNFFLTEYVSDLVDLPTFHKPRSWAAFCELDLVSRRILKLVDISKQEHYNFWPNRPPEY